jgi:hypothetical protein
VPDVIPPFIDPPPAIVHGYAARDLAIWLRRAWDRGDFGRLPPDGREQVYATIRAIEYAGEAWQRRRVAAVGNSATPVAAIGAQLSDDMSRRRDGSSRLATTGAVPMTE